MARGAEFGHLDQQCQGGGFADAGNADENVETGFQGRIGCEVRPEGGVDGVDLALDLPEALCHLTSEQHRAAQVAAVAGRRPVLHQRASGDVQLLHLVEGRADDGTRRRLDQCCEAGKHGRIDGVGLGVAADRLGETAGLARIDLAERQPGRG